MTQPTSTPAEMVKDRARSAVKRAVASGRLKRPSRCEQCGAEDQKMADGRTAIHGHHHRGYDYPLDVQWLCPKCHFQHDPRPAQEANGRAKLAAEQVRQIRAVYRPGCVRGQSEWSAKGLARKYGVSDRTIRRIVSGEIWSDAALQDDAA